jgi:Transcription initiation factor IID, 18kD subunit
MSRTYHRLWRSGFQNHNQDNTATIAYEMFDPTFSSPTAESLLEGIGYPVESTDGSDIFDVEPPGEQRIPIAKHSELRDSHDESHEEFRERLMNWFEQMMFVSGETAEPSAETTGMIEELVKQQVIEMVSQQIHSGAYRSIRSSSCFRNSSYVEYG